MNTIPTTMTWEMLRRGRWRIVLSLLGALALPILLLTALRHDGLSDPQDSAMLNIHVIFMLVIMFCVGAAAFDAQGRISKLYAYPIRTSTIVAWRMLPAMAIIALQMVFAIVLLNLMFDLQWPVWGPAATAAVAFGAVDAVVWLTEKSINWLIIGLTALAFALGMWFRSRYGYIFFGPPHYWREISVGDSLTMLAIGIAAYWVSVAAVARNRRGEPPVSIGLADRLDRLFESMFPSAERHFDSAFRAQCWMEWQRKGWVMPFCVLTALPCGIVVWLITSRHADDLLAGFFGGAFALPFFAFVAGALLGGIDPNDSKYTIGHFLATRPISDADLSRAILTTAAKSVIAGWAIWALAFAIACGCVALHCQKDLLKLPPDASWWYFPATLLAPWIVASVMLVLGLLGRPKPVLQTLGGIFGVFLISVPAFKNLLGPDWILPFWHTLLASLGGALLLCVALIFTIARRRGLVERPTVWVAAALWLLALLVFIIFRPESTGPRLIGDVLGAGIAAIMVLPLAATPLAISFNRHR